MFEQTFVPYGARGRSPASIAISFAGQAVIVLCLLLAPLLQPQVMHYVLQHTSLEPPPLRPKPVPLSRIPVIAIAPRRAFEQSTIQAPVRVPQRIITMITDPAPELMATSPSVAGVVGLPGGLTGGISDIARPTPPAPPPPVKTPPTRVRVSSGVQQAMLISQAKPVYPPLARSARISGSVTLQAIIGKDGTIQNLQLISGHPLLSQAALAAVAQWRYRPTLLGGDPVEVSTQIVVNFVLSQ
jgi:protein TonB